jgi:hypothetical protein
MCGKEGESRTEALAHVRRARERMAEKGDMPEGVRADVLRKLDEAIARLESENR